ncbi:MAG TPA: zf-HC2 domain-containing protein [Pyrinomonadaceae bacterium]|nr:zf-HC2 domain-containing protein [Pyrinomonadaceae bacterium]
MNCEECQRSISAFLDCDLDDTLSVMVRSHLALCTACAKVCEDFAAIVDSCRSDDPAEIVPPNAQALWCRINNIIESEVKPPAPPAPEQPGSFVRRWNLSLSQTIAAVAGVAVISSLLTIVGIRNYFEPSGEDFTSRSASSQTSFEKLLSKVGLTETPQQARERRLKEQQAAIAYWDKRVQARKSQWDNKIRDAFDRNLNEIDQAVYEYNQILQVDPQDDLSGEMLDSAMTDKMNLLREFADL